MLALIFLYTLLVTLSAVQGESGANPQSRRAVNHRRHLEHRSPGLLDGLGIFNSNGGQRYQRSSESNTALPAAPPSNGDHLDGSQNFNDFPQQWLDSHNSVRVKFGAENLQWNDTLAAAAQTWSNRCDFHHSRGSLGPFGENLAAGTGDYPIQRAANDWASESSDYDPRHPQYSHFTQMVWKATTQLGCAVTECEGIFDPSYGPAKFYTCEYYPQGNVIGQFDENVGSETSNTQ